MGLQRHAQRRLDVPLGHVLASDRQPGAVVEVGLAATKRPAVIGTEMVLAGQLACVAPADLRVEVIARGVKQVERAGPSEELRGRLADHAVRLVDGAAGLQELAQTELQVHAAEATVLGGAPVGDVARDPDESDHTPVRIAMRPLGGEQGPRHALRGGHLLEGPHLTRSQDLPVALHDAGRGVRREQLAIVLADHLGGREAQQARARRVDHQVAAGQILGEHRVAAALDDGVKQSMTGAGLDAGAHA